MRSPYRRHLVIPDPQCKKSAPPEAMRWIGQAIVDYAPDVIVNLGDHYDMPSLSSYDEKGSLAMEGARYADDIDAGNEGFELLSKPAFKRIKRTKWRPEFHYILGNHEDRIERAINAEPKFKKTIGYHHLEHKGWKRHDFLDKLWLDGIVYSHYFQQTNSGFAIAGTIDNRLNRIGASFVQGHMQGLLYGNRIMPIGVTRHGLVAGSSYLHREVYRGNQGNHHWRGIVVLNQVKDGHYDVMPLSMQYLCRRYEGRELRPFMERRYKDKDWSHLDI